MVNYRTDAGSPVSTDDFVAIQRLVHRYAEAVVLRDDEQWASCWAEDATWDLGPGRMVHGRTAIVELWRSAMAGMAAVVQMVHNGDARMDRADPNEAAPTDQNRAVGRWFIDERYRRADGEPGILLAHYDDTYVRSAEGGSEPEWRFSSRFLQKHYQGAADLSGPFQNTSARA
jgi:hypothetical protein